MEISRSTRWDFTRSSALARASLSSILNMMSLLVSIHLSLSSRAAAATVNPTYRDESDVLQGIVANAWLNRTGLDPCRDAWHGVTCDGGAPRQHVVGINLNGTGGIVAHAFFSSIARLPRLRSLSLANCSLKQNLFSLSSSLLNLSSSLRSLDLSGNSFVGEIPEVLGDFPFLDRLSLAENQLQGQVPEVICAATSLTALRLGGNALDGPIPPCLGNLSRLAVLNISHNNLNGPLPESLGQLRSLRELDLGLNSLTKSLPASLTRLSNLTKLHLSGNLLEGALPADIDQMTKLQELYLDSNQFSGPIPDSICRVRSLQKLRLFDNQLTGNIPEAIGSLTQLTILFLHVNQLDGPLPVSLGSLTFLQELQLQGNRLNGTLQGSIWANLTSLRSLYIHFNELEGELPPEILLLGSLSNLSLGFNKFSGSIPNPESFPPGALPEMANLKFLSMCNNSLTGSIPSDVSRLGNLEFLDLSSNQLNGSIPSDLLPMINSNHVQANLIYNNFDQSSWSKIQGRSACSQLLNSSVNKHCLRYGSSKGVGINVGGPHVQSYQRGRQFVADESFTSLLGFYGSSSDTSTATTSSPEATPWVVSGQGVVQESKTSSIITSSAGPPSQPRGWLPPPPDVIREWTLFQTARVGGDTLSYRIGYFEPGEYVVDLYFAELDVSVNRSGQRIFSVYIQGELRIAGLDIFNRTGGTMRPLIFRFRVSVVSEGVIDVRLVGRGSWPATQEQMMVYRGPILSALLVSEARESKSSAAVVGAVVGGILGLAALLAACLTFAWGRRTRRRSQRVVCSRNNVGFLSFTYAELEAATSKFSERNLLGQGAFGRVFKGVLPDGNTVAIKQFSIPSPSSLGSLQNELLVISTVRHRNLVPLIGCCLEQECPIIVCEFMPNGNLHDALFKTSSPIFLSWPARCTIALDIARGLHYLHEESVHKIVHRDVKPVNILLNCRLRAHIADFGLARLLEEQELEVITNVVGTRGYMAPEYALHGQLSDKADVFSFGVVLLELVVGRRGMQSGIASHEQISLCHWAWQMFIAGRFKEMVDKRLGRDYELSEAMVMLKVALWCTETSQSLRPPISQVVRMLSNQASIPPLPRHRKRYGEDLGGLSTGPRPFRAATRSPLEICSQQRLSHGPATPSSEARVSRSWNYSGSSSDLYILEGR